MTQQTSKSLWIPKSQLPILIGLVYRKPLELLVKTMVYCRFSLQSIPSESSSHPPRHGGSYSARTPRKTPGGGASGTLPAIRGAWWAQLWRAKGWESHGKSMVLPFLASKNDDIMMSWWSHKILFFWMNFLSLEIGDIAAIIEDHQKDTSRI